MSEESTTLDLAELTRRQFEAVNRRDMDALISRFPPDGVYDTSPDIEGLWAALGAWTDEWTDVGVQAEGFTEVGARVLVLARQRGVGRHSGVPMSNLDAWVFSFRGGRIVRWDAYWNPAEARRAVGIEE